MVHTYARFVMARLILGRKPQLCAVNLPSAVLAMEPFIVRVWRPDECAHIGPCMDAGRAP